MAEKLTPQQARAVRDRGGKLLVSAAAGSGKTKVLVDRLLGYLKDPADPADLDEFLIITYTKAAASELRGKIAAKLTEAIAAEPENRHLQRQMQRLFLTKISTVHGFCSDILREYAYRLDLSADFRVADENECRELRETVLSDLLDRAYERAEEDADFRAFVDTQGLGRDDRQVAEIVLKVYDSARCHLDPEGWLQSCLDASQVDGLTDAGQTVWGKYLMEDLFSYLDGQIAVMRRCAELAERAENMEKPAVNLRDTLYQLERLRQSATWDEIVARKNIDYGRLTFPRKGIDEELADRIKACRAACKKGLEKNLRCFADDSAQVLGDLAQSGAGARGLVALVRQFSAAYERTKHSRRVLDFSDLEHKTLDLLLGTKRSGPTAAAREIGRRFREIMVDEYQDSNGVQDAIFSALTAEKQNCFMVGDVKQSIYQFRLADPGIFLEKYHSYVPAENARSGEGRKVLLSANFRSGGEVIAAVNDVFEVCMSPAVGGLVYGEEEKLREGIPHLPLPGAVELCGIQVREETYGEEPAFVARQIKDLLDGNHFVREEEGLRPITPEDIVILLRSPGSVGARFQQALEKEGIRCSSGGGTDLLRTEEIDALRSLLQTIANPRQDIPLIAALAGPVFGFTADDLASFRSRKKKGSVYDALLLDDSPKAKAFLETLAVLRGGARMNTIAELIERIFALTRMDSIYAAMPGGEAKRANLQTFYRLAADYESVSRRDLNQFLDYLQTQEEKGLIAAGEAATGCVTIMSIHKSKGLEFPVVFLCGLSREFNRESLRAQVLCDRELGLGLSVADTQNRVRYPAVSKRAIIRKSAAESLSEEMRVLYVAMTRARDRLIMTYAAKNLQGDLQDIAGRLDISGPENLTRDAVCPGEWVLLAAMQRTEAGEFFSLAGARPDRTKLSDTPWIIRVAEAAVAAEGTAMEDIPVKTLPEGTAQRLAEGLAFRYAHWAATLAPSKQTATQRKGRVKDQEAAEDAQEPKEPHRSWRRPSFVDRQVQGKAYGSAIHAVMQYIRYESCGSEEAVRREVERLVSQRFITEEQGRIADCRRIAAFFDTPIGRKLRSGTEYLREFKFSILDDGSHYGDGLEGEEVLLQGVVDCALLEEEGITIVDFKTDYVTEETLSSVVSRYRPQVETYAHALSRIYGRPVRGSYLYFFHLDRFVEL
ncbi:MAG: helicase-exonuclease AddAB subunit AddA [Oscillospiraceae bacterium]|nr:helicase-exonuclease AddAB subunit AddA [Oscillospiraceae bacterium]